MRKAPYSVPWMASDSGMYLATHERRRARKL